MAILELKELSKHFGHLVAVNELDLTVEDGEIRGLIGPNGSGKTTTFNLVSGFLTPTKGRVFFQGEEVTGLPAHVVARRGLVRTFQLTALFRELTALQNVIMACHLHTELGLFQQFLRGSGTRQREREMEEKALALLDSMGIADKKDEIAGDLPHGHQRALGIVSALATEPRMLLLDEPVGGMTPAEAKETMDRIKMVRDRGVTVLLVEHDMKTVMTTCEKITCMNFGNKIAEGTPQEISMHQDVIDAYLGGDTEAC
ncbi:MAG: ATP-binding cassette domain-containing protein [Proteobacteria bacterium]|nr:ATP-binding cassette domain-containing protein [Pseudomonadota bacterium]NIS69755.1 ATP-binding cassette domain-containing protein [Pseudomonadota bacterium]